MVLKAATISDNGCVCVCVWGGGGGGGGGVKYHSDVPDYDLF